MEAKDKICKLIEKLNAAAPKTIGTTPVRWNDNVFNVEMNGSDISTLIEILDKLSQMPSDEEKGVFVCYKECGNTQPSGGSDNICLNCGSSIKQSLPHPEPKTVSEEEIKEPLPDGVDPYGALKDALRKQSQPKEESYKEYCRECNGELKMLETVYGDNEGIRHDRECINCGQIWGCSKGGFHKIIIKDS